MNKYFTLLLLSVVIGNPAQAQPWSFSKPIPVSNTTGNRIFHHLESSGRHNIAVSTNSIAVVWEDNRDGTPRIYLGRKTIQAKSFTPETAISGKDESFEPSIAALSGDRFVIAWEENEHIHLRIADKNKLGPVIRIDHTRATQASLSTEGNNILLALTDLSGHFGRIMLYRLHAGNANRISITSRCPVDPQIPKDQQSYPSVIPLGKSVIVAWEDRRPGHTIIMAGETRPKMTCAFNPPQRISENRRSNRSAIYGKGTGAARVAITGYGVSGVMAAWADKRNFREGYDIFSAKRAKDGSFAHNVRVQDEFGDVARQWHPTISGNRKGMLAVAWDDDRDGTLDIILSWLRSDKWSDDLILPGASGPGIQNHPSIVLDRNGNLHIAWVERATAGGPTQLKYMMGSLSPGSD